MLSETLELRVFHSVVKHSSYARAAEELGLSPSGVSRIISRLESRLGVRLMQRTTRKLSLTEAGRAFCARTQQVLADLSDAEEEIQERAFRPQGNLRVSAPVAFGQRYLAPLLVPFLEEYPDLRVELTLMDRFVDLVEEGLDLAIRIGQLADSRLNARRLCSNQRVLVASPEYLRRRGRPKQPQDLSKHECVLFTGFSRPREWRLLGPDGPVSVPVSGRIASNNIELLTNSACAGLGVTIGATMSVGPALLAGQLERVLPSYQLEPTSIFAVYPSARQLSVKVRATVDFLVEKLGEPPSWDRRLEGKVPGFPVDS